MSVYTKDELSKKSLVEVKVIGKTLRVPITGSKNQIINQILDSFKPIVTTVNNHSHMGKNSSKIYGIKLSDKEKLISNSKALEEKKSKFLYYSMGFIYFSSEVS